jgi:hypothetical protein
MSLNKFDIFTYQLSIIQMAQLNLFEKSLSREELMERKNIFFNEIFKEKLSFYHRRNKLNYKIEFQSNDFILLRLANKRVVHIEREFHRESFESEPSCLVGIYNTSETQYLLIESDRTSFGNSFTVVRVIEKAFEKELAKLKFRINIHPKYEEKEFWELLDKYPEQIEGLRFEFEYPNLPRVNKYLSEELKETSKKLNSSKTKVEFLASDDNILDNLSEDNSELNSLVKTSAEGAGPVKIKIKGFRRWESTENKVKSIEFDSLEVDAPNGIKSDYINDLKYLLNNE